MFEYKYPTYIFSERKCQTKEREMYVPHCTERHEAEKMECMSDGRKLRFVYVSSDFME